MSQNPIEPWKLTAFLFNELDPDDRQLVEAAIASDSELKQELESLRSTLDRTRSVLAAPIAGAELAPANRALIASEIQSVETLASDVTLAKADTSATSQWKWKALAALAASFLIGILAWPAVYGPTHLAQVNDTTGKLTPAPVATTASTPTNENTDGGIASNSTAAAGLRTEPSEGVLASLAKNELATDERGLEDRLSRKSDTNAMDPQSKKVTDETLSERVVAPPMGALSQRLNPSGVRGRVPVPAESGAMAIDVPAGVSPPASDPAVTSPDDVGLQFRQRSFAASNPNAAKLSAGESLPAGQTEKFMLGRSVNPELSDMKSNSDLSVSDPQSVESLGAVMKPAPAPASMPAAGNPVPSVELQAYDTDYFYNKRLKDADGDGVADSVSADPNMPLVKDGSGNLAMGATVRSEENLDLRSNLHPIPNPRLAEQPSGDRFEKVVEAPFVVAKSAPLSTFSIDVDTASYSKIRQYLVQANALPQPSAVRIEEMINYFDYTYAGPTDEHPYASNMAVAPCPWNANHQLIRIGLQAKKVEVNERPKANIVFLLDVSGSMDEPNKLPLVKQAIAMLTKQLGENDRIAMVVYAGAAGCVLPSITGDHQTEILAALDNLSAGGSTNGGQGIELAYSIARDHFIPGGINRIILCTDGDFNVGTTSN